ncbi:MAG: DMT family transporter [Hyphomicrobiaceae bacterium]
MNPDRAIALKLASVLVFTVMASLIKAASAIVPAGEATFFRSFFALPPILVWLAWQGDVRSALRTENLLGHIWRGVLGVMGMVFGFAALGLLPFPEAVAIGYAMPLLATAFAAILLGEVVRMYRWSAILIGMVGVLVILWPRLSVVQNGGLTGGETLGALCSLASAALGALSIVATRRLVLSEKTSTIVLYFSLICSAGGLLTLPFGWVLPDLTTAAMLIAAGILGGIGQLLLTESYRHADTSTIAPFDYTSMLFALAIGYIVFAEVPTLVMLAGAAIVIAAGLFVIWREHQLGLERARARKVATPQG